MTTGPDLPPPEYGAPPPSASGRDPLRLVRPPAIALIVISGLSVLMTGATLAIYALIPKLVEEIEKMQKDMGTSNPIMKTFSAFSSPRITIAMAAVGIVLSLFVLVASIQMVRARSYGLAVAAAVVEILNVVSLGCCCIPFNVGIGIWALVILLRDDVKAAFRAPT
jgi:hypothetical protein